MVATARAWRRFWIDTELRRALCEGLVEAGAERCLVDCTPPSAERSGAFWCALGARAAFGMIPVSDGTELVLEVHPDTLITLRERIFPSVRRSLRRTLEAFARRLEAIGE